MHASRLEVMNHLEPFVAAEMPKLLRDPEKNWQPSDYTPDLSTEEGFEEARALQREAREIPDDVFNVLVGDMITEEALPTYSAWISTLEGVDVQGEPRTAWGAWNRGWCGEENRHGDLLNRYLYLSGRVNMREVEVTVQNLIHDGGETGNENDPYRTFVYTSFQEIATRVSHLNVAKEALNSGAGRLHQLCSRIAGDEHRHSRAYKLFFQKILDVDTEEALLALQDMMKKKITMPAMYMREKGADPGDTFRKFEVVARRTGIYTPNDYVEILENLVDAWKIPEIKNLSGAAAKAQDYLCGLPDRYRKVLERFKPVEDDDPVHFAWMDLPAPLIR